MIDILLATIDKDRRPIGLEYVPGDSRLLVDTSAPWATAANNLLDRAEHDALFLDDDITLLPSTFDLLERYYNHADVFGFALLTPIADGQAYGIGAAGMLAQPNGQLIPARDAQAILTPHLVAHCTTSLIYIKHHVIAAGVRFPVWPGAHYEDVAFTYDCWLHGFKVMYLPGAAIHPLTNVGAGKTKSESERFAERRALNEAHLKIWTIECGVPAAIARGEIPGDGS